MDANMGGAAFPHNADIDLGGMNPGSLGMTLRDYFATHSVQPGVAETVTAAGLYSPDGHTVWSDPETQIGTFNSWWAGLTNEQRFDLWAKVRFQAADAMLAARGNR